MALSACAALSASARLALAHDEDCCQSFKLEAFGAGSIDAASVAGYDEATGRALRNYPPSRESDHLHIKIDVTIPTMDEPRVLGRATLSFSPIAREMATLTLDARAMTIRGVESPNRKATFTHDGMVLKIALDPPAPAGEKAEVTVAYELFDQPEGLLWTAFDARKPERTPQYHTQGQAESNSYWFPCRDFPNDRMTTEVVATVPEGFMVSSNGKLVSHDKREVGGQKAEVWHWLQDKPHVPYLVSMVVGKFDVVDLGTKKVPMPVYTPLGRGKDAKGTYGRTGEMVEVFERLFDEPYPWDRYAQLVVTNFNSGGMENTGATSMHDSAIIDEDNLDDFDLEGLISHELAHQWFGDLITCNSWEHIWLNEGFATYLTALWYENRRPAADEAAWTGGHLAYDRTALGWFDNLIDADKLSAPAATGMTTTIYSQPWEQFRKPSNPYPKGASILHMLRRKLGDEVFFKGLQAYVDQHKFKTVETSDLRRVMEETSGESLEHFFWQWCTRPGIPRLDVSMQWDDGEKLLRVRGVQTQQIDGDNPAYEIELPIQAAIDRDNMPCGVLVFKGREASIDIPCVREPRFVAVDHLASVLAQVKLTVPRNEWLVEQARGGATLYSRVQAVRALGAAKENRFPDALAELAIDDSLPALLRVEALRAATLPESPRGSLNMMTSKSWEVREAACARLGDFGHGRFAQADAMLRDQVSGVLLRTAANDQSLKVRGAAIRAMGKLKDPMFAEVITAALAMDSHSDTLRNAALDAAVDSDMKECIPSIRELCALPHFSRTRASAIEALSKLSKDNPAPTLELLAPLATDRVTRVQRAAAEAIVRLNDPAGLPFLDRAIETERSLVMKRQLITWRDELNKELNKELDKGLEKKPESASNMEPGKDRAPTDAPRHQATGG